MRPQPAEVAHSGSPSVCKQNVTGQDAEWSFLGHLMHSFSRGKGLEQVLRSEERVFFKTGEVRLPPRGSMSELSGSAGI